MNLKVERKIKFWLSTLVKILVVILIFYKLVPFVLKENDQIKIQTDTTSVKTKTDIELPTTEHHQKKRQRKDSIKTVSKTQIENVKSVEISEILRFKGKILKQAYFKIGNCNNCSSTVTKESGVAKLSVPIEFVEADNVLDFYVYASDTLVYHRAMRLSNIQFDKY